MSMYRWRNAFIALCATAGLALGSQWQEARAVPTTLTVQGHLSADGGASVTGDYTIVLSLYNSRTAPTAFWEESNVVTVVNGLFDARIGADALNPVTLEDFSENDEVWIGITVIEGPGVPDGGEAELPRRRLGSTGYAFAAGFAESAASATRATNADNADSATTAGRATTADSAGALSCSGCITVNQLGFDPATQVELQNALAALDIPTNVNGLGGGTISSAVTVNGAVTATSFNLSGGQSLCDSSGNCGATLTSLNCVAPNDTPVYNHGNSAWECGPRDAGGSVVATDLNCSGCVSESELDFNVVTDDELATALAAYATTAQLANYATNDALGGYATTAQLSNYATTASLSDYATNAALSGYATTASLSDYATNAALSGYATTASLSDYATNAALSGYATNAALADYATNAALAEYPKTTEVASTLENYTTLAALAAALGDYATVADVAATLTGYVSADELAAYAKLVDLEDYALKTEVPTSIDGLAGGSVSGNVTATGNVEGAVVRQNGNVVCDVSGNCGQALANLNCAEGQTIKYNATSSAWECGSASQGGSDPGINCTGDYKVLQWDGDAWICRDLRKTGLSQGEANGWEIVDNWGDAWDAIERTPMTWQDALDTCVAEGGRLPTVTELWRNRASAGGTGNFADATATRALWTLNPDYTAANRDTVVLSSGAIGRVAETSNTNFRCIWPKHSSDLFDGNYCFGPPGAECKASDRVWNLDRFDRPPVDGVSANWECNFFNASLMDVRTFQEVVHGPGFDNVTLGAWQWTSDFVYTTTTSNPSNANDGYGYAIANTGTVSPDPSWGYDNNNGWGSDGSFVRDDKGTTYTFRCLGRRVATPLSVASPSCVDGNCFTASRRGAVLVADNVDRGQATQYEASKACNAIGGRLPRVAEAFDLVRNGWENGSNNWLWTSDIEYVYTTTAASTYRYPRMRWEGAGTRNVSRSLSMTITNADTASAYRCVWGQVHETTMTSCEFDEDHVWTPNGIECRAAVDGSVSAEDSNPSNFPPFTDAWGNAWDLFQRDQATYSDAAASCAAVGGRLPTATELFRVRNGQPLDGVQALGQSTDTAYQWTMVPSAQPGYQVVLRLQDGATSQTIATGTNHYRCIWPTSSGDVFGSRSCYGDPSADGGPCFESTEVGLRMDRENRASIFGASASWECRFYGGRLPNAREYEELIHQGLPNGDGAYLSTSTPAVWGSDNAARGRHGIRFDDGQQDVWAYQYAHPALANYRTSTVTYENQLLPFRCVYSNHFE